MKFIALLVIFFTLLSPAAKAEDKVGVIAVVGNDAITNRDLIDKLKITFISAGLENTPENISKMRPQILQNIINEKVQIKEANKLGIKTSEEEIENALRTLEQQNNMQAGGLRKLLSQNSIPVSVMKEQVEAEISWAKIKSSKIRRKVDVSDTEIDVFLRAKNVTSERNEFYIHEIVIPVEKPTDEEDALVLANNLQAQLNEGKSFEALARQFSAGATAKDGGAIGWLAEKQIPVEIMTELAKVKQGEVTSPIRSIEGYFLAKYSDKKYIQTNNSKTTINLKKFFIPIKNPKNVSSLDKAAKKLSNISDIFRACTAGNSYAAENGAQFQDYGSIKFGELPSAERNILNNTGVGKPSSPKLIDNNLSAFMICERIEEAFPELDPKARARANDFLLLRKIELQARKYLRDLRAQTNIEIR